MYRTLDIGLLFSVLPEAHSGTNEKFDSDYKTCLKNWVDV